jgi:catechol 2,3-dioxygenase-like lactoylglutathione lyase family enzyme
MPVRGLIHYALEVPAPVVGETFYRDFGLREARSATPGSNSIQLETGRTAGELILYEGARKRLHHLALAAPGDEFEAVRAALRRAGIPEIDPPRDAPQVGIWFHDPDGNLVNVRQEAPRSSLAAEPQPIYNAPGNPGRPGTRGLPTYDHAEPRRLGHVLFFTPDPDAASRFYSETLGFKVSDWVPGVIAFLRCTTDHHNVAFAKSTHRGFHHASYEVGSVDEIGVGAMRMKDRGWEPAWGLGRHAIGSNFFYYIKDPWGSYAEYFHDIDYIPEDAEWDAREWDPKYALYCWGPDVPSDFIVNKEEPI